MELWTSSARAHCSNVHKLWTWWVMESKVRGSAMGWVLWEDLGSRVFQQAFSKRGPIAPAWEKYFCTRFLCGSIFIGWSVQMRLPTMTCTMGVKIYDFLSERRLLCGSARQVRSIVGSVSPWFWAIPNYYSRNTCLAVSFWRPLQAQANKSTNWCRRSKHLSKWSQHWNAQWHPHNYFSPNNVCSLSQQQRLIPKSIQTRTCSFMCP